MQIQLFRYILVSQLVIICCLMSGCNWLRNEYKNPKVVSLIGDESKQHAPKKYQKEEKERFKLYRRVFDTSVIDLKLNNPDKLENILVLSDERSALIRLRWRIESHVDDLKTLYMRKAIQEGRYEPYEVLVDSTEAIEEVLNYENIDQTIAEKQTAYQSKNREFTQRAKRYITQVKKYRTFNAFGVFSEDLISGNKTEVYESE